MQIIEQGQYSKKAIINMLHSSTRTIDFRYDLLNYKDEKIGELDTVLNAEVSMNSLATNSKRVAQFSIREDEAQHIDWLNDRIQPFVRFKMPDSGWIEYSTGIFLPSSPTKEEKNNYVYRNIEAYDGLKILLDDKFEKRYIARQGESYVKVITDILLDANITKINLKDTNLKLRTTREFEIGTEKLRVINELLKEMNYTSLWVDEFGYFTSSPYKLPNDRKSEYSYKDNETSIIIPGVEEKLDLFNVPNKFIVVVSNPESEPLSSTYSNMNPASLTSISSRRRNIVDFREVNDIADQESLDSFTKRIAYEASQVYGHIKFRTAIMPFHSYNDLLHLQYKSLGINHDFVETSWKFNLKEGAAMQHSARRVIQI